MNGNGFDREKKIVSEQIGRARIIRPEFREPEAIDVPEPPDWLDEPERSADKGIKPAPFMMVDDLLANSKPTEWLVKGYIEKDAMALAYGPPKQGKSFIAFDLACSVVTGTPWHGHRTKRAPTFIIAGEGLNGLRRRLKAWSIARNVSLAGSPLAFARAAPLTEKDAAASIAAAVAQLAKQTKSQPGLIIVDTLARSFSGDENNAEAMGRFIRHLDEIRATYEASVLIVHHSGKNADNGARGSSALFGAVDASFSVTKDASGIVTLQPEAMKDASLPPQLSFELEVIDLGEVDDEGETVTSCAPSPTEKTARKKGQLPPQQHRLMTLIWDVLRRDKTLPPASTRSAPRPPKAGQTAVSADVLREHVRLSGGLSGSDKPDTEQKAIKRAISGLQASNNIEFYDGWIWLSDKPDIAGHLAECPVGHGAE